MTPVGIKTYRVNEIFYSIHGEGFMSGTPMVFVRFAGCDLACGFCDTEFESYKEMSQAEIVRTVQAYGSEWVCFTGGEPMLQLDDALVAAFKGHLKCIETNGLREVCFDEHIDHVTVSPKTPAHTIKAHPDEWRYIIHAGDKLPEAPHAARHAYLSPVHGDAKALKTCIELVKAHPGLKLSTQQHKEWGIR